MAAMEAEETEEEISPQFQKKLSSTLPTMQEDGGGLDLCPSFNSYTIDGIAETAARVTMEFEGIDGGDCDCDEDEFEFVSFQKTDEQMVLDCPIRPVFPIFNHDLLQKSDGTEVNESSHENDPIVRISLEKLIIDDRERERDLDRDPPPPSSSSSSEADELDGIPPGTYCVWTPKPVQAADRHGKCKKSKSTGSGSSSSRRWRLRNLLPRSNSEGGKNPFVFLTPSSKSESTRKKLGEDAKGKKRSSTSEANAAVVAGKSKAPSSSSAHELFYVRNRMLKEEDKRRSYLPYRQDLVGFWANLSSVSKALPPF